jgi:hypothetical protein
MGLDLSSVGTFFSNSPDVILLQLFFYGGWIPFAFVFLWGAKELWLNYLANQWYAEQSFVLLAIDVPRGNAESLRTVENLFTYLAGAHGSNNLIDTYWVGKFQLAFSFEIVSIDGYTQFLVHTPKSFRNLVESAIYSVYPDAEISEVNDYTQNVPQKYPDSEYDLWGAEFIPVLSDVYPIKTYPAFQDQTSPAETAFKDPMASFMDLCASLRPGEQLWYQIIVKPTDFKWVARADAEVSKLLKEEVKTKKSTLDHLIEVPLTVLSEIFSILSSAWSAPAEPKKEEKAAPLKMMDLKPKDKKKVESIQLKAAKLGFECKVRFIYVARKDVINKPKVINGFVGYIKQFIDQDLNNFKPDMDKTATSVNYLFKDSRLSKRQNNIIAGYRGRSGSTGRTLKILNIEELATLWHFPIEAVVRAPLIQKAPGRKSEPPMSLPLEELFVPDVSDRSGPSSVFAAEVLNSGLDDELYGSDLKTAPPDRPSDGRPSFFDEDADSPDSARKSDAPGNLPFA